MSIYYRPIIQNDASRPDHFYYLGGQRKWFDKVEIIKRGQKPIILSAHKIPPEARRKLTDVRRSNHFEPISGPLIMGIINVTPDSFSDGGRNFETSKAVKAAENMIANGVNIIDIGGESTRPGAEEIPEDVEFMRISPLISAIKSKHPKCKISVDTRKSSVMRRVIELGVDFINDVSALTFDEKSRKVLEKENAQICLMHGGLNPKKMQKNIFYDDVLLDVYDYLEDRIEVAISGGIKKENILIDPGIGFGKTTIQNIVLIRKASIFHSLGCPIVYGVSRKRFIGELGQAPKVSERFPGSMAVAIELIRQGVQVIRVHDVQKTRQALDLWEAICEG